MSRRAWSTTLYCLGGFLEIIGMWSLPGFMPTDGGEPSDLSVGYWLIALLLWVSVFFRARYPLAPTIAGGLLALAGSSYLLLFIGLHHLMVRAPKPVVHKLFGLALGVVVLSVLRDGLTPWGDDLAVLFTVAPSSVIPSAVLGGFSFAGLVLFTVIERSRRAGRVLQDRVDREHDRASQLDEELARKSERERIAREMHDTLASRLSAVALQGDELALAVSEGDPQADAIARSLRQEARRSLDDLRGLLGELREGPGADYDPSQHSMRRIGELVRTARATGTSVDALVLVDGVDRAAAVLDHTVYRIVQEALTNATKHAARAPISISVEASPATGVRVRVTNPLRGASELAAHGSRTGLIGIRERVDQLGGACEIGERDGEFVVDVSLPWVEVETE